MKPKTWGDPDFTLRAVATPSAKVAYAADGPCTVKSNGTVHLTGIGTCTISAKTTTGPAASTSLTFDVAAARPVISFKATTVAYTRPFGYQLVATSRPSISIAFHLVAGSDPRCRVSGRTLTLVPIAADPPSQPSLPSSCIVEAMAAKTSSNYSAPDPVRARIQVTYPNWNVDALSPQTISYAAHHTVTVTIREPSGDSLGMDVQQIGGEYACDRQSITPAPVVPAGTTTFKAVIALSAPPPEGYTCQMQARAAPEDWQGDGKSDTFTIHVVP